MKQNKVRAYHMWRGETVFHETFVLVIKTELGYKINLFPWIAVRIKKTKTKNLEAISIKEGGCLLRARLHAICFHLYYFTFTSPDGPTAGEVLLSLFLPMRNL